MDNTIYKTAYGALSDKQRNALHLMLGGSSEKQIAQRMLLSPHSVHTYVKVIYRRFGVNSRAQLLAALLVPSPEIFGSSPEFGVGNRANAGHTPRGADAVLI